MGLQAEIRTLGTQERIQEQANRIRLAQRRSEREVEAWQSTPLSSVSSLSLLMGSVLND